jgi:hypothetical protein
MQSQGRMLGAVVLAVVVMHSDLSIYITH